MIFLEVNFLKSLIISDNLNPSFEPKNQRLYKNLSFDYSKLEWWIKFTQNSRGNFKFKFAHIVIESDKHKVVKTYNQKKLFVLNVNKYVIKDVQELAF